MYVYISDTLGAKIIPKRVSNIEVFAINKHHSAIVAVLYAKL